ncbi:B-cell receptor CD22-like isoform X2 [Sebastes umbrosus]|uniref:B-cell receptor CD22-like isoform X2 n=1 Tax=Sebastes umbrosus TaxID=72105 RepID=UPI00189E38F3|nr:B-cell receptor CD22-like isoform X2 [Sebastes umbrosus]
MLISGAGCVFMGFILFISGVQGRANSICALKGSSVDLPCSDQHPTPSMKWYTVHSIGNNNYTLNEISADGNRVTYNMSAESNFTLTIKDLTERDRNFYCCRETDKPENCRENRIQLHVADLQVKVIPTTEGQTVTLICSTSCPLTENPAVYIWYKNREFLYQDWSPWYQQLVSSEEAVTYSCAIKGYEDLRAPQVSVDSVSSTCFKVTYAKGTMCSSQQTSENEPCSITYPTEVNVQMSPAAVPDHVRVTCNSSCPPTAFIWYRSSYSVITKEVTVSNTSVESFSCAVKGREDLRSAEVCLDNSDCWSVNYVSRRICALEGSSVNISSDYSENQQPKYKLWYKIKRRGKEEVEERMKAAGRVEYHDNMKNQHILRINNLKKDDSAKYTLRLQRDERWKPGVTLVVTGVKVQFSPSAVVTEDQRVTLTCSTSCPLTDNTNYIWFFNSRPLTLTENQNKHLVLDPVSSQHAGNYSCAVRTHNNSSSHEETLTVQSMRGKWTPAAAAGVCAALLVIIPLSVFCWIRKRTSSQSPRAETSHNMEQVNSGPVYDDISAQPTEQDDLHYSRVHFPQNQSDLLYSTVQTHPPQEQDLTSYAVVNFRPNTTPEHDGQAVDP